MNVEIDKCLEAVAPWDLEISSGGETCATRRPSVGLVTRMLQMGSIGPEAVSAMHAEMFAADAQPKTEWPYEAKLAAVSAYLGYFNESVKNYGAIVKAATAAVAKTPETSLPNGS